MSKCSKLILKVADKVTKQGYLKERKQNIKVYKVGDDLVTYYKSGDKVAFMVEFDKQYFIIRIMNGDVTIHDRNGKLIGKIKCSSSSVIIAWKNYDYLKVMESSSFFKKVIKQIKKKGKVPVQSINPYITETESISTTQNFTAPKETEVISGFLPVSH